MSILKYGYLTDDDLIKLTRFTSTFLFITYKLKLYSYSSALMSSQILTSSLENHLIPF